MFKLLITTWLSKSVGGNSVGGNSVSNSLVVNMLEFPTEVGADLAYTKLCKNTQYMDITRKIEKLY